MAGEFFAFVNDSRQRSSAALTAFALGNVCAARIPGSTLIRTAFSSLQIDPKNMSSEGYFQ